jgi:PAS domain S-box-containing protein
MSNIYDAEYSTNHARLREWYLAKLRSEAGEQAQNASLTPLARIYSDRQLLEDLVMASSAEVEQSPVIRFDLRWVLGWVILLLAVFVLILADTRSLGQSIGDFYGATIGILLLSQPVTTTIAQKVGTLTFFCLPVLFICLAGNLFFKKKQLYNLSVMFSGSVSIMCAFMLSSLLYAQERLAEHASFFIAVQAWSCVILSVLQLYVVRRNVKKQIVSARLQAVVNPLLRNLNLDQTKQESLVSAIKAITARENLIAEYALDWAIIVDPKLVIRASNKTSMRLLHYMPEELLGKNLSELALPNQFDLLAKRQREKTASTFTAELCCVSRKGDLVDFKLIFEWSQTQGLYFVLGKDISDEKRIERTRTEFLSTISHDVRTPLSSILLGLNSVAAGLYGQVSELAKESVLRAHRNVKRIIDMVSEAIDLEQTSERQMELQLEDHCLRRLSEDCVEQTRDLANHLGVEILNTVDAVTLQLDRQRVMRVMVNILNNAIKHSPEGGTVRLTSHTDALKVKISIEDQGPGIPSHLCLAVFDRYYRVADGRGNLPSTGLGLAICKAFVQAHGGLIGVVSTLGKGSTFWFTLPTSRQLPD